jgi:hypothetical protein
MPVASNFVRSERRVLEEIGSDDPVLRDALAYWRSQSGSDTAPERKTFDITKIQRAVGSAHIIDCSPEDPDRFSIRLFASRCLETGLFAGKNLSGLPLSEVPCSLFRASVASDYHAAKTSARPSFHKVIARLYWRPSSFTRLILPLANDTGQIAQLLVLINQRPLPELGTLPATKIDEVDPFVVQQHALEIRAQVEAMALSWGAEGRETMGLALALTNLALTTLGERYGRDALINFIEGMLDSDLIKKMKPRPAECRPPPH